MKPLAKPLRRLVEIRARGEDLPARTWVLTIAPEGILLRREGTAPDRSLRATWKQVIGCLLAHGLEGPPAIKARRVAPS